MPANPRRLVAVVMLTLGLGLAFASPSTAASATITSPEAGAKVLSEDPLQVEGSCPVGSRTATAVTSA